MLIAYLFKNIDKEMHKESGPQACLASLTAQNWVINQIDKYTEQGDTARVAKPWPRSCRTKDKILSAESTPDVTREVIRLMSDCWYQMGSGRFSPFEMNLYTTGEKCFICYTFRAPQLENQITDVQFNNYLRELSMPGSDISLYRYFNGNLFMENRLGMEYARDIPMLNSDITAENYYAVVFLDVETSATSNMISDEFNEIVRSIPEEQRHGISKLYITDIEQASRCIEGGEEAKTGD